MEERRNRSVYYDMERMAEQFPQFYADYYKDVYDDVKLQEMTTQPFWQSMRLTKRRMLSKGLKMDLSMQNHLTKKGTGNNGIRLFDDGSNIVGTHQRNIITQRNFSLKDRRLRSKKEYEHLNIYMLQGKVEGEEATCPNCGHVCKISEFIDGCDFCGSKFSVKDFETKVSGFSMEENTEQKLKRTMGKTALTLAIITGVLMAFGALCMALLIGLLAGGNDGVAAVGSLWGLLFALDLVPVGFRCLWILLFIFIVLRVVFLHIYKSRIVGEEIVKNLMPDFSGEDFCQNLEYKLRNIHMTDNASEVAAFASCPLDKIVEKYRDVVDCNVTRCKFIGAYEQNDKYIVRVVLTMRLALLKGHRVRTKYERVMLLLSGKKNVINKKEVALREYKCSGCNSSINILEGSTCRYCSAHVDYSAYGWVIDEYQIEKRPANVHAIASSLLIMVYVLIFATHLIYVNTDTENDNWASLYKDFRRGYAELKALYESVPMPDSINSEAELMDSMYNLESLINTYKATEAKTVAINYLPVLLAEDFTFSDAASNVDFYVLHRKEVIEGDEGYLIVVVSATEDTITVAVYGDDEVAENKNGIRIELP